MTVVVATSDAVRPNPASRINQRSLRRFLPETSGLTCFLRLSCICVEFPVNPAKKKGRVPRYQQYIDQEPGRLFTWGAMLHANYGIPVAAGIGAHPNQRR